MAYIAFLGATSGEGIAGGPGQRPDHAVLLDNHDVKNCVFGSGGVWPSAVAAGAELPGTRRHQCNIFSLPAAGCHDPTSIVDFTAAHASLHAQTVCMRALSRQKQQQSRQTSRQQHFCSGAQGGQVKSRESSSPGHAQVK
jgi:hypothetical protein